MAEMAQASTSERGFQRSLTAHLRTLREQPVRTQWILGIAAAGGLGLAILGAVAWSTSPEPTHVLDARLAEAVGTLPIAPADPAATEDALPSPSAAPVVPGDESTQVMEALREREIRALDVLLLTREEQGPMTWSAAQAYCTGLQIRGLGAWRLPTLGELASMTQSGMGGRQPCWSSAGADTFGDEHMVWWGKRNRAYPHPGEAHVICVRSSSPHPE